MRLEERNRNRKTQKKRIKSTIKKQLRNHIKKTHRRGFILLDSRPERGAMHNIPGLYGEGNNRNNLRYRMRGGDTRNSLIPGPVLIPLRNISHGFSNMYNSFFGNLPGANPDPWNQPIYNKA